MSDAASSETAIVFAPIGRDAAIAGDLLAEVGIAVQIVKSIDSLVAQLSRDAGFVILTEESLRDADLRGVGAWLAAQPEWSDLPFILLTSQGGSLERNPAAARYLKTLGNVTFIERPFHPTTLVSLANAALRARRRQYEARSRLETIRLGEQRLRVALSAGGLGSWSIDVHGQRLECSAQCKAHYGREPTDTFSYEDLLKSVHVDDRTYVRDSMKRALDGAEDYDVEYRCIWPNGEMHWVQVRGRIDQTNDLGGVSMSGVTLNTTQRKTVEAALQRSEERFRAAVEAVQGVVWTNTADGKMTGEQPGWAKLTGQSHDQYEGFGWADAVHPDDAAPTVEAWSAAVTECSPFVYEHRLRVQSGDWGNFAVRAVPAIERDGTIREWVGVHTDITQQRTTETQLEELANSLEERVALATGDLVASQTRLRSIFETSFQYFAELTPRGIVLDVNATSLSGIEHLREDIVGKNYWDTPWFSETLGASVKVHDAVVRASNGETVRQELILKLPAGTRTFDFSIRPVRDAVGKVIALVPEAIDLTDRREAEERLMQSQKLETIGQLTGGVAHDFNNLLTPIVGSLELLRSKLDGDERALRWASAGLQSAERARVLVNRLLSFARRQALETKAVAVPELIAGMRDLIGRSIGPTIDVRVVSGDNTPAALVDPNQLELSILNLCVNARDAMPDGGYLTISVAADEDAEPFDGAKRGDYVRITVADTGTGMSAETAAKSIEPFYTTKGIGKGTGLGLSMVHGLAGQLGGGMAIDSGIGAGTRISIWLPVADNVVVSPSAAPSGAFKPPSQSAIILLVDDEELVRFATADMLRDAGYLVIEASSGHQAQQLVNDGLKPNVLVTDQLMPNMKGTELAIELAALDPELSVLIATGYSDLPDVRFPRISKPFTSADLVERVRMLVEADRKES